ncbi:hypothetical protein KIN20_004805 [Parelaphostrongylus tenuis]|uniref:Uncharacterized protein n=1 Tax=Parelaphostrongylus tenuis TaxID=148309 RepID=A0AAD5M185_PARTN|nr:hypothetical protein KIN20_004805 [Parelaphostrongylus tenuis]
MTSVVSRLLNVFGKSASLDFETEKTPDPDSLLRASKNIRERERTGIDASFVSCLICSGKTPLRESHVKCYADKQASPLRMALTSVFHNEMPPRVASAPSSTIGTTHQHFSATATPLDRSKFHDVYTPNCKHNF